MGRRRPSRESMACGDRVCDAGEARNPGLRGANPSHQSITTRAADDPAGAEGALTGIPLPPDLRVCLKTGRGNLKKLGGWNRCLPTRLDCANKSRYFCVMSFVLPHVPVALEHRPSKAAQGPEVIQLQSSTTTEDLQPFLGEGARSVGEVVHCADRAVLKAEVNAVCIAALHTLACGSMCGDGFDRRICQEAQQVHKMATFTEETSAAYLRILSPMLRRNRASIDGHDK